jgi:CheY-like chemotaxis protein
MIGKTVLVVEDNKANMILVTALLQSAGFESLRAFSAEEAITIARDRQPDMILMDISLPGIDGLTATSILKRDPLTSHIPVVALTAGAVQGDEALALDAGCTDYMQKPIEARSFHARITGILESSHGGPDVKEPADRLSGQSVPMEQLGAVYEDSLTKPK